jgi:hypothetical protein
MIKEKPKMVNEEITKSGPAGPTGSTSTSQTAQIIEGEVRRMIGDVMVTNISMSVRIKELETENVRLKAELAAASVSGTAS